MNHVAKILIVANLVFSVVLAVLSMQSYAWRENYKRRWDQDTRELKKELDLTNQKNADLSLKAVRLESTTANLNTQLQSLQAEIKTKVDDLAKIETDFQAQRAEGKNDKDKYQALQDSFLTQARSLDEARKRNGELNHIAQVARAVAFNLNVKLSEVEDDLNNIQTELAARNAEQSKLVAENNQLKAQLAVLQRLSPSIYRQVVDEKASTRHLEGVVAAVKESNGVQDIVMLTIGANSGVEEGVEFIIYRNNQYIAKVRTERVMPDMAACRIIPEAVNGAGLKVQQGDLAANHL